MNLRAVTVFTLVLLLLQPGLNLAQQPPYPAELRGYKVETGAVNRQKQGQSVWPDSRDWIRFGQLRVTRITRSGVNLELPIVVSPVKQKGQVDFLVFENVVVNGTPVRIDEYHGRFDLPNEKELVLREPLKFFVSLPNALQAAIGEWSNSTEKWRVTGRIYVFGRYKKFLFSFKRTIPIELDLMIANPLKAT